MSLEVQRDHCHACAQEREYAVVVTFEDTGRSEATLDRPGVKKLRELAQAGAIDVVIVTSVDRLARSAADLAQLVAELEQAGVAIEAVNETEVTDTQASALMLHLETAFAQFERERLVRRMVRGKRSTLSPQPAALSATTIRRMFQLYTAGLLTAAQFAEQLNREGAAQSLRVAIYARAAVHASVTSQLTVLRAAAEAAGWSVTRVIIDRSAGGGLDRQELQALCDAARASAIDLVLVVSLDRLARRVRDVAALREELAAAGCAIVVLAQDATRVGPMGMTLDTPDEAAA